MAPHWSSECCDTCLITLLYVRGTHEWDKFITPDTLQTMLEAQGCQTRLVHGMRYNPLTNNWSWSSDHSVNYALHAVKKL